MQYALAFELSRLAAWIRDRRGVTTVEYAVVIGTLSGGIILSFTGLGGRLTEKLANLTF